MCGIVSDRVLELIDGITAEEAEGNAGRRVGLDRAVAVIGVAPAAGRHAFVDELCGSRKVSVERRTSRRRAAVGLCAADCEGAAAFAGDRHRGSGGRGQRDQTIGGRGALSLAVFAVRCPCERAAIADSDAANCCAVAHDEREVERIVAVRGRALEGRTVEVQTFNGVVHRDRQRRVDGLGSDRCGVCRKGTCAQRKDHHNCQENCCELFHSVHFLLKGWFPVPFYPRVREVPRGNAHSFSASPVHRRSVFI